MRILNLYSGIGGNRKLWNNSEITEIVSVELNPEYCYIYSTLFPNDRIIQIDAKQYLLENYQDFDFIWISPPCQTHSNARHFEPRYIDLSLYQLIIFCQKFVKCKWVIENVQPYYDYLIKPNAIIDRHAFWSNFRISDIEHDSKKYFTNNFEKTTVKQFQEILGIDLSHIKIKGLKKITILRNCVHPITGKLILDRAIKPNKTIFDFSALEVNS